MEEMPDLARSIERHYPDPDRLVDTWADRFVSDKGRTGTIEMLVAMTHAIKEELTYIPRHERGIQSAGETLSLGSGTCRDFAVLMMEAARSLGLAARFVSGYIYSPLVGRSAYTGGGSTHAWARIYLPGAGWLEFDPTNGLIGSGDLIRVAITRDPRQALPLSGTYTGFPADHLGMNVEVSVTKTDPVLGRAVTGAPGAC
jgi:transglutaminase-like putative cysteine protease